ncbi:hypothetical protein Cantr_03112 [Candida viswanathii]|uniref:Uncharacterized protein n=1 Tax=Candida viswanathii TaxID=5486 RepID=A0A367YN48_9ASCO|nr:hypothetical protein Cantr_03112 [Candida viswanathii]
MSLFKSKAYKENEIIAGSKSSTIKSFFGFNRDKPPPPPPALVVSSTDKNNDPINVNSCNQILQPVTKTIHTTIPTFDMFQSPKFKTCTWPLRLLPQYKVYLLIYVRLENGQELLNQLYRDIHSCIDYYQPLDQGAILIHSKQPAFHYSMLKLTAPVFGIQMVVSNGDWLYLVHNYSLIRAFAEMNLQMVKFVPLKYPRIIITVLGILTRVRRVQLVRFFKRIEKLVSYKFAPIGRTTKFHVIYLQYSRFLNISEITSKIRSCNKSIKFILRHDSLLQNAISTLISS